MGVISGFFGSLQPMMVALAIISCFLGILPMLLIVMDFKKTAATIFGLIYFCLSLLLYWIYPPNLANPLWGMVGALVIIFWWVSIFISFTVCDGETPTTIFFPIIGTLLILIGLLRGWAFWGDNDKEFAAQIKQIRTNSSWSADIRPEDHKNIQLVEIEGAAKESRAAISQLDSITNGGNISAIGSQFTLEQQYGCDQVVNGRREYVFPLDFRGSYFAWSDRKVTPGYFMYPATDPKGKAIPVLQDIRYSPNACFEFNLDRHMWRKYQRLQALAPVVYG